MKKNIPWKPLCHTICTIALSGCLAVGLLLTGCGRSADAEEEISHTAYKSDQGIAAYSTETAEAAAEDISADDEVAGGSMDTGENDYTAATEGAGPEDASTDVTEGDAAAQTGRKLIRNMSLSLETTAFDDLIANVESRVNDMGGYIEDSSISGDSGYQTLRYAYLTVRIPVDQLDAFADAVAGSATVLNRSTSVSDVTLQYSDLESHMEALKIEQQTLMDMLAKAEEIETVLAIQNQLTNVRYELESYGSQLKLMENQVSYSTVNIDISEVEIPTPAVADSFGGRVSRTFQNSMSSFAHGVEDFLVWFLGNIVFVAIFIVIVILICLGLRKIVRKWKQKRKYAAFPEKTETDEKED
ncbi:MAG TPA: hypothetical protein DF613_07950 [Lachnospiraceae bacterium]|nr:hypothetical protein [Lachnospiraceae bacterium]